MDNYVGKRLDGRYEIQDIIGVGGMAVVYKAYDNIDDRIVAIKILKDEFLANEEFRRRFKNESKAIAILSHPNIVKVYDVSFGDKLQYIVMEYIEGITLKEYIEQRKKVDWNEALFFVIQILRALQHAHDKGIVHRDIKPQNIMLLENGSIKVADFGIARFSRSETRTMTEKAIGSVHYISPEQAKGEITDEKADIYSVGVVLYEMLTGVLPFDADNAVSVALMQVQTEPKLPRTINPGIPVGFEQITMKAMQKNPRDRYQTAAEMLLDLEELKRNPSIKFDYATYFVDTEPTRFVGKLPQKTTEVSKLLPDEPVAGDGSIRIKTAGVPPVEETRKKLQEISEEKSAEAAASPVPPKKNNHVLPILAGVVCAILVFAGIVVWQLVRSGTMPIASLGTTKIEVDDFYGMNYERDIKGNAAYEEKYNFEVEYVNSSDLEPGTVKDQDPGKGSPITKGGTVKLTVVKSGEDIPIPNVSNTNYLEAYDTLEKLGFTVKLEPQSDTTIAEGLVIKTDPAEGTSALANSTITVYYAISGKTEEVFKMPNVAGKSLADAKAILKECGLVLARTKTVDSTAAQDEVVSQSPQKNEFVQKGSPVILTVSSGIASCTTEITLPNLGNMEMKITVDGSAQTTTDVNTQGQRYSIKVRGAAADSAVKVYLDGCLYYEATVDFSRSPARVSGERSYDIPTYVDVTGISEADARKMLNDAGYKNIGVAYDYNPVEAGIVIAQTPGYLSSPHLDFSANIILTVSKGPSESEAVNQ